MTFQSVGDLLSGKYRWNFPSVIPFVINMMNSVHNLPTNLPTEQIPLVKMTRHHFFFNFFSHGNSLGISVCIYQFSGSDISHLVFL